VLDVVGGVRRLTNRTVTLDGSVPYTGIAAIVGLLKELQVLIDSVSYSNFLCSHVPSVTQVAL